MITLRPYQEQLIDETRAQLRVHNSVLMQLATGAGKTAIASQMLSTVVKKGYRALFICHRIEIIDQTMETFSEFGIPFGVIAAGYPPNPLQPIQICSIDTLKARIRKNVPIPMPAVICLDESHHAAATGWAFVKAYFSKAKCIGLSATPERLDAKGLNEQFDALVCGPPMSWLIEQGYLSKYRPFAPSAPDLSGVHTKMGDFVRTENEGVMDKSVITGDAIKHYLRLARDKRALAFCVSIKHSQHVVQQFKDAGVVAWHLDGETDRGERRQAVEAFRRGEIKVLSNVELFGEGFNVPAADVSIMLRPTKSLALYLQQCGRVLRPSEDKKHAILLDHAGNIRRHGFPDDDRVWSLMGRKKKKSDSESSGPPMAQCPNCFMCHRPAPVCPGCGHVYERNGREVEHVDGELEEIDIAAMRAQRAEENARATKIEELLTLGIDRRYRNPEKWAAFEWTRQQAAKRKREMNRLEANQDWLDLFGGGR